MRGVVDADRVGADANNGAIFIVKGLQGRDERAKKLDSRSPEIGKTSQERAFDVS